MSDWFFNNPYAVVLNNNHHPEGFRFFAGNAGISRVSVNLPSPGSHHILVLPYAEKFFIHNLLCLESKPVKNLGLFDNLKPHNDHQWPIRLRASLSRSQYIEKIRALKQHIQLGDIYEINFCMGFFAEDTEIDPLGIYSRLNEISEAPFSALLKLNDTYIICSSPERFLKKEGDRLYTQPIKGTARRSADANEDLALKTELSNSLKERTENVMIVDVARNDLSKIATKGSVQADELFGIHTYKQVHQMVSTVSCTIRPGTSFENILEAAFPMPSMTGAPKQRATELIKQYEPTDRGFYSGCIGYMDDKGDFDLNVVIRSIVYDAGAKKLSFHVGSAITAMCEPEAEYDECMLKAGAMLKALNAVIV